MAYTLTQRFRRQVSPYNVVQSLAVLAGSSYCPALQTIQTNGQPNIDRTSCPTVIQATISASSSDNSGSVASIADSAVINSGIKWMVQRGDETSGKDIQDHAEWGVSDYSIGTGADKGKLTISKNVPAGTTWKIWLECIISDQRRTVAVPIRVVTDSVLLYSIADSADKYTMSLDHPACEPYEPARDNRLIHEYLVGKGIADTLADDGNTHLRAVTATLRKGGTPMPASDYTLKVFSMDTAGNRTEATPATDDCVASIAGNVVTFDLRFAKSKSYQIACYDGAAEACYKTYGWVWSGEMPTSDEGLVGGRSYSNNASETYRPKLNLGKAMLCHPEIGFDMKWYWKNLSTSALTYIGAGETATISLDTAGLFSDGEAEVKLDIERRGAFQFLTDDSGNRLVDENGDYLITN